MASTPTNQVDELIQRIADEYNTLSKQLKIIAKYVEKNRDHIGLEGILEFSQHCGVQPSAVVRFSKHFGFSGFSQLQAVFREGLSRQIAPSRNYKARIREVIESGSRDMAGVQIANEYLAGAMMGIQELLQNLDKASFEAAVDLMLQADALWVVGSRRSFPIATYLDYALQHTDKRVGLVSGMGSMQLGQVRSMREDDVVIAISFAPYSEETLKVLTEAKERGAHLIAITDSLMSPVAEIAHVRLVVQENSTFGFRSLTATMGLAQSLFIALAFRLELGMGSGTSPA